MTLRVVCVGGPLRDSAIEISGQGLTIGRSSECDVVIPDQKLSRSHCTLQVRADGLWIADGGGRNGTSVNGARVSERRLHAGDRVQIGVSTFIVEDHDTSAASATRDPATTDLDPGTARYLAESDLPSDHDVASHHLHDYRSNRDLRALLTFSHKIQPVRDRAVVHQLIVDALDALFGGDLVALALFPNAAADALLIQHRPQPATQHVVVSRTVLERVRRTGLAALCNDVTTDAGLRTAYSIVGSPVQSILCAPLLTGGELRGAVYVASTRRAFFFGNDDLQLITALANIASLALENVAHLEWLSREVARSARPDTAPSSYGLIGESAAIRAVAAFIGKASRVDSTVLVLGESGTGKELVARAIHNGSARSNRPFVSVNCAALPEQLLESELFGFEAGAFSDARRSKPGRLELADRGTLFLDEVGELSLTAQAKLLRAIQEREIDRLGGTRPIRVNVRLIAATNRDLSEAVSAGTVRADFYHRFNVLSVTVPPLRDRRFDIPLLSAHFLDQFRGAAGRRIDGFSEEARTMLMRYSWPGNVRELQNAIERAVVLGCSERIMPEDLPDALLEHGPAMPVGDEGRLHAAVNDTKRRLVLEAFEVGHSNFTDAARYLGIHPNHLHRLVRNLDLRAELGSARGRALF